MMQSAIKHLRYYRHRIKAEFMQAWEYRFNTLSASLGTYGYTLMTIFFIDIIFKQTQSIAGWDQNEILLLFGLGQLLFYLYNSFFVVTSWGELSQKISLGSLDQYLLKPLNPIFSITTDRFTLHEMLPSLILPYFIIRHSWLALNLTINTNFIIFSISIIISFIIIWCINLSISSASFWWTDTTELQGLYHRLDELQNFPATIYPKSIRFIFLTLIPVGLVVYVPTVFLLHGFQLDLFLYQLTSLIIFVTLTTTLWTKGLQNYTSASS
jgi:ABC-2 type transport system permease protein